MTTPKVRPPAPGIYERVPFAEYKAWDAINVSSLKDYALSARHVLDAMNGERDDDTPSMVLGRAIHCAVLEGSTAFREQFMLDLAISKNSNDYKAWRAEAERSRKQIITQNQNDKVVAVAAQINAHPLARKLIDTKGAAEVSIVWADKETGLTCKARVDRLLPSGDLIDIKTCASAAPRSLQSAAIDYGYDMQAAHYIDAVRAHWGGTPRFHWIFVETDAPFGINICTPSDTMLKSGRLNLAAAMRLVAACRESGNWPLWSDHPAATYSTDVRDLTPPGWREAQLRYELEPEEAHL